ncbi:MAG TPA: hypothetical protein VF527_01905 [Pyrinomonadaceae bacterium]
MIVIPQQVTLTSIKRLQEPEHPQMSGLIEEALDIDLGTLATKNFTGRKFAGKKSADGWEVGSGERFGGAFGADLMNASFLLSSTHELLACFW